MLLFLTILMCDPLIAVSDRLLVYLMESLQPNEKLLCNSILPFDIHDASETASFKFINS